MGLLETYELMKKAELEQKEVEVPEVSQVEEEPTEEMKLASAQMEVLANYAQYADDALRETYGEDYEVEDVEKLAEMLINHDLAVEEEQEKVAELVDAGKILAQSFAEELQKIANKAE